jgi:capsular exopolysaccharide synthesis family protein
MAMEELNMLMSERNRIADMLSENAMETMLLETKMNGGQTALPPDAIIERELEQDPVIQQLKSNLAALQQQLSHVRSVATGGAPTGYAADLQSKILQLDESIAEHKAERKPRLLELFAAGGGSSAGDPRFPLNIDQLTAQRAFLEKSLAESDGKIATKSAEVASLENFSADVAGKRELLEGMRQIKDELGMQVERIKIEQKAPPRIRERQDPTLEGRGDAMRKYVAIAFSMMLSFAGVVLAVAVLEFQARKVNSVKEVNDGLGIRVIGELPNISGRAFRRVRGGKGKNVLKALMAERIDGTRTALIHTTAIDPPRVVMVTSAQPHEGKTTTSSQLAASLARSGRRTLLIDADVRNPGVHRVFEMPQDPGLCELLRGEAERDAVIHPTRTANLWLMPAGRCDLRSVQALSGSYLGSAIAALSVQFDYVIIDAGPVLKVADPLLVGQHVDAAIVSVLRDVSKVPNVYEAVERLRSVGITVLGSVVNGVKDDVARHGVELLMAETPRQDQEAASAT